MPCLLGVGALALACGDDAPVPSERPAPARSEARAPAATTGLPEPPSRPNVVLITLDTTRADALGAYGQTRPTSPALDRLADRGALFEHASTSNPETLPAHATLFTGKWPFSHGVRANAGFQLTKEHTTLAEILRRNGYRTGAEVAAQVLGERTRIRRGFDHARDAESSGVRHKYVDFEDGRRETVPTRPGSDITARGIEFVRQGGEAPFFLWLHYFDPHDPYSPPEALRRLVPDSAYHAEVASADLAVGRFLAELDRRGIRERTLVVVTADHGEGLGDHDEPTHSFFVYEATMRVPLILAGPGVPRGVRVAEPVRTIDVVPTLLELLELPVPDDLDGASLLPLLRGESGTTARVAYGEASRFGATFGLPTLRFYREGRWKYIHKVNPELYDVEADPSEVRNLYASHRDVAARLRRRLDDMLRAGDRAEGAAVAVDAETAAQLAALGYAPRAPDTKADDPMALFGADPIEKIKDTRLISEAQAFLRSEAWGEACERLESVALRNPESVYVHELTSRCLLGLGRDADAIEALRYVLDASPCDGVALSKIGEALRREVRYPEMVSAYATGAEQCPDLFENLNNYAWALATLPEAELRDGARAVALFAPVIEARPDVDPMALDTLAAAYAEAGDFPSALETQQRALERLRAEGGPQAAVTLLESHLGEFRAGRPLREP